MIRLENIYAAIIVLLILVAAFTCLVNNANSGIIYFIVGTVCAIFVKFNRTLIWAAFLVFLLFAIIAQLTNAEWFYHDMPDKITVTYLLMSSLRGLVMIVPICLGTGISWFIDKKSSA